MNWTRGFDRAATGVYDATGRASKWSRARYYGAAGRTFGAAGMAMNGAGRFAGSANAFGRAHWKGLTGAGIAVGGGAGIVHHRHNSSGTHDFQG